ncbi:hypothetical protein FQN60_004228 [Etheostoma spectabile]|uniref:Uncharacterized protein n=1 Tax=Etheostoma spectabile TaxID=54343 RepID=A0A5J5CWM5_9PERO|nr:hypothetical protein FQN60_004228 [Etheostoma spectabile]
MKTTKKGELALRNNTRRKEEREGVPLLRLAGKTEAYKVAPQQRCQTSHKLTDRVSQFPPGTTFCRIERQRE